jgi:hypothetical protein
MVQNEGIGAFTIPLSKEHVAKKRAKSSAPIELVVHRYNAPV